MDNILSMKAEETDKRVEERITTNIDHILSIKQNKGIKE